MRVEIPKCARCCICIPLRYGIIIFGYLNLGFSMFLLCLEYRLRLEDGLASGTMAMYRGVGLYAQVWLTFLLYILEIVFNIVLLVGAHMKKPQLMRAYYYYGVTTTLAALVCYLLITISHFSYGMGYGDRLDLYMLELCFVIGGVVLQVYLLLLIRSELAKLEQRKRLRFTNQVEEIFVDSKDGEEINF